MFTVTNAVTIEAPVERVWPWPAQMGSDRASWDAIDDGAQPSALSVVPGPVTRWIMKMISRLMEGPSTRRGTTNSRTGTRSIDLQRI